MSCNLTTTTTNCISCIHPLDYLFEKINFGLLDPNNKQSFAEILDRILDKGIVEPNCGICCSDCDDVYVLASLETYLIFTEQAYNVIGNCIFQGGCCINTIAGVETMLKLKEATDFDLFNNSICCNEFTECTEELFCWITQNSKDPVLDKDRILDKGIVEHGNIINNCTGVGGSSICKLVDLFAEYYTIDKKAQAASKGEIFDRILDKGIVFYCNPETGDITIGSVETWMKYAEATSLFCSGPAIPAPISITETTTTVVEITTTESVVETTTETTTVAVEPIETTTTTTIVENV
jgi:hypothetical protein